MPGLDDLNDGRLLLRCDKSARHPSAMLYEEQRAKAQIHKTGAITGEFLTP